MSNLYIRLHSSFWTHPKTLLLKKRLGSAAYWLPPRIWSFAAENAPDGDLSIYQADDLAMLVQYSGDAQAMLEALHEAGFLENGVIKNWEKRNSFHVTNHNRAKTAAEARWAKARAKLCGDLSLSETDTEKEKEKESKEALHEQCLPDARSIELENLKSRIGSWFKRRSTTVWQEKEIKALKAVMKLNTQPDDIDVLEAYYKSGNKYLRRDIFTLLNNWTAEIDRAKQPPASPIAPPPPPPGQEWRNDPNDWRHSL